MDEEKLSELLLQLRPISYRPDFAKICDSVTAGVMLSQAYYWTGRSTKHGDGWFEKTSAEWYDETGLSDKQQQTARHILSELGFMESERKGDRGRMCSRVKHGAIYKALRVYYIESDQQKGDSKTGKKEYLNRQKGDSKTGKKANLSLHRLPTQTTDKQPIEDDKAVQSFINNLFKTIQEKTGMELYKDFKLRAILKRAIKTESQDYIENVLQGYLDNDFMKQRRAWNFINFFSTKSLMEKHKILSISTKKCTLPDFSHIQYEDAPFDEHAMDEFKVTHA